MRYILWAVALLEECDSNGHYLGYKTKICTEEHTTEELFCGGAGA